MRRFETKTRPATTYEECVEIRCDLCGRAAPSPYGYDGNVWGSNRIDVERVSIKSERGYNCPEGGSSKTKCFDVCVSCFNEKIVPFMASLGAEPAMTESDW